MSQTTTAQAAPQPGAVAQNDNTSSAAPQAPNTNTSTSAAQQPVLMRLAKEDIEEIGDEVSERMQLSQDLKGAAQAEFKRISGVNPEDLTDDARAIVDAVAEEAAARMLKAGAVRLSGSAEAQTAMLQQMYETRRTTARKNNLPSLSEVLSKAMLKAVQEDSKSLGRKFADVYGFAYDDFKKEFGS